MPHNKPKQPTKCSVTFKAMPVTILKARSRDGLLEKIKAKFPGRPTTLFTDKCMLINYAGQVGRLVYRLEKHRKKTVQIRNEHGKYSNSTKVRENHWIAEVFIFTSEFPVVLTQYNRCFSVMAKSKMAFEPEDTKNAHQ